MMLPADVAIIIRLQKSNLFFLLKTNGLYVSPTFSLYPAGYRVSVKVKTGFFCFSWFKYLLNGLSLFCFYSTFSILSAANRILIVEVIC